MYLCSPYDQPQVKVHSSVEQTVVAISNFFDAVTNEVVKFGYSNTLCNLTLHFYYVYF